jgi:hypothetical protein
MTLVALFQPSPQSASRYARRIDVLRPFAQDAATPSKTSGPGGGFGELIKARPE